MTYHEHDSAVARFRTNQASRDWRYQAFRREHADDFAELARRFLEASRRAEVRVEKALLVVGTEVTWICLYDENEAGEMVYVWGFDDSHPCPPFC